MTAAIVELPVELLAECLCLLPTFRDLLSAGLVSKYWNEASNIQYVWKTLCHRKWWPLGPEPAPENVPVVSSLPDGANLTWRSYSLLRRKECHQVKDELKRMVFSRTRDDALARITLHPELVQQKLQSLLVDGKKEKNLTRKFYAKKALKSIYKRRILKNWNSLPPELFNPDPLWNDIHIGAAYIDAWVNGGDPAHTDREIASLADQVEARCPEFASLSRKSKLETIIDIWINVWKFRGNVNDYYNEKNSFLSAILQSRVGIPITLSVIFAAVCRRLSLPIEMIGFPGHFLIACPISEENATQVERIFIDVFDSCTLLSTVDLQEMLHHQGMPFSESLIKPIAPHEVYSRMLRNLNLIYNQSNQRHNGAVYEFLFLLEPNLPHGDLMRTYLQLQALQYEFSDASEMCNRWINHPQANSQLKSGLKHFTLQLRRDFEEHCELEEKQAAVVDWIMTSSSKRPEYRIGQVVKVKTMAQELEGVIIEYDRRDVDEKPSFEYLVLTIIGTVLTVDRKSLLVASKPEDIEFDAILEPLGQYFDEREGGRFVPNERVITNFPNL